MALCIVMVTYSYKENARSKHSLDFGIFKKKIIPVKECFVLSVFNTGYGIIFS